MTAIQEILDLDGLERIEERRINRYFNDVARRIVGEAVLAPPPGGLGLDGTGEVIAIADSGLDTGDAQTVHADFRGRVRDIQSFPVTPAFSGLLLEPESDDGAADRFSGHGTHVAGSAVGNGARSVAEGLDPIRGTAPPPSSSSRPSTSRCNGHPRASSPGSSSLVVSHRAMVSLEFRTISTTSFGRPTTRVHGSTPTPWGGGRAGVYDDQCRALDEYVWNQRDFLVLVAAGNEGSDQQPAEGIDPTVSVRRGWPKTA